MATTTDPARATPARGRDGVSSPRLGVVLNDLGHYTSMTWRCPPGEPFDHTNWPPGFFENPRTWAGLDVTYAVAPGATVTSLMAGEAAVTAGFIDAARRLASCSLVISDCGFFFRARKDGPTLPGNVMTSSIELVPLAAALTTAQVGVLTFSADAAEKMLSDHPLRDRLRIVGLTAEPSWGAIEADELALDRGWSVTSLADELGAVLERAFAPDGAFAGIGVLLLECTLLPQFRRLIRRYTSLPILDIASFVFSALDVMSDLPQHDDPRRRRGEGIEPSKPGAARPCRF